MMVKITEIIETDAGKQYRWFGGYNGWRVEGVATKATGKLPASVGDMGWMDGPEGDSIHFFHNSP